MAKVVLESEDKEQFEVLREVALKSTVIRQMIETNPDNDEPIPLVDRRRVLSFFYDDVDVHCTRLSNPTSKPFPPTAASPTFSKKCSTT
jgi:hypothetical protein